MIGRGGLPMAPPSRRAESEDLFERVRDGESITDLETMRRRKDGTLVAVSIAAAPVRDASGRVVGNMVAYTDITERKAQEERLHALIDSSPLALVEFDLDTRIRLWNAAAERIFGWSREEMIGRGGLPMAPPSKRDESEELFERVLAGESVNDLETERRRKDGTLVAVSIAAAPVRDASGDVVGNLVAYTDITARKAQEAEVHRLNDELHARLEDLAASRARIVTAGDVERRRLERNLHDGAQQRLVALSLALRVAQARVESDPDGARAMLAQAGEELSLALAELRELARGLHPAVLTDRGLRAAVEMLAGRTPVPVEVAEIPDERLPEPVEAAAYYLIAEALTNVAKYAEASTVRVRVAARDASLLVEVADDGVGGADPAGGSGLRGLADRVEALGGSLDVFSPAGTGTCLRAVIPSPDEP
jgi:PAS domain S-box-containing protein